MNSDSYFESDFIQDNKGLITILSTVILAFLTIYWLYRNLKPEEQNNFNQINFNNTGNSNNLTNPLQNNLNTRPVTTKKRLMLNASSLFFDEKNNFDMSLIYQFLQPLSELFDLYLVVLIKENEEMDKILDKFSCLVEDKIIFKHVKKILKKFFKLYLNFFSFKN